jgi:hypothetical protein
VNVVNIVNIVNVVNVVNVVNIVNIVISHDSKMVESSGFEPEAPSLQGRCSTGLSYDPIGA